jgi:hypothetical protein
VNIEAQIHTLWPTIAALEAVLPVARVFTGRARGSPPMPYACLTVPGSSTRARTSQGMLRDVQLRIQHWVAHNDFPDGRTIQERIEEGFGNRAFDTDDGRVIDMRHEDSFHLQDSEATSADWQFVTIFSLRTRRDRTQ